MVTGWRRAFCTSIPKDRQPKVSTEKQHCDETTNTRSPKISSKFGFFSSNPSTPRLPPQPVSGPTLRCRTTPTTARTPNSSLPNSPKLQCHVTTGLSNPSSPKSPSPFSLLKLRVLSKRCGICLQSVKAGQGTAIFTAECSHSFHFPCIASQVKKSQGLLCPVCSATWRELPLLSIHHRHQNDAVSKPVSAAAAGKTLRVYDDDEPLTSPTSGARLNFNPIPENDEEEEFRGFFASGALAEERERAVVEVRLLPEAAIVAAARGFETRAVVMKVKAPAVLAAARRAPIDVVAVVDVASAERIVAAKRVMRMVVSSLGANDRLSIVAFSAASKRLLPLRRMSGAGKRSARRIADALGAVAASGGHGMSVGDAVKKAAKVLEDRRERNPSAAIVLLSDQSRPVAPLPEVPLHALGLSPSAREDHALAERVTCLLSVVVQDLRLHVGPTQASSSSSPVEIAAVYSLANRPAAMGRAGSVRVGDLYAEEEREFLLELRVPTCGAGSHHVLSVRSTHRDPSTELLCSRELRLVVPRAPAVRSAPPAIERLRSLHVATRAVAESRRLADHGDFSGARHMLTSARALLAQSKSASAEEFSRGLEAELVELQRLMSHPLRAPRAHQSNRTEEKPEPLTPTSAWRAAERLAKVAIMRKSMNRVSDLHGFENARF